jgi:CubicO group peptidase (beta-lactamase class C family)
MRRIGITIAVLAAFLAPASAQNQTTGLPVAPPEAVGFSAERLAKLTREMRRLVDDQEIAGIVTMVARHGKLVSVDTYGQQDLAAKTPLRRDSIFRIYSMTKPITGVAMMMLYEDGKWHPDDPLSKHIPEFTGLKVYAGAGPSGTPRRCARRTCAGPT